MKQFEVQGTMMLITSTWDKSKTFRLMPISNDAPFVEGIYDPISGDLALITKQLKDTFHMLPRLDDNGDTIKSKTRRPNGKDYKEERKSFQTFMEHYVTDNAEISSLIKLLAFNSDSFDFESMMKKEVAAPALTVV